LLIALAKKKSRTVRRGLSEQFGRRDAHLTRLFFASADAVSYPSFETPGMNMLW